MVHAVFFCYNESILLHYILDMSQIPDIEGAKKFYARRRFDIPGSKLHPDELPQLQETEIEEGVKVYKGHSREDYGAYIEAIHSAEIRKVFEKVCRICEAIGKAGGRALIVGGAVRDEILGIASKDFDIEVYGLEPKYVEDIVSKFGEVNSVGKAFGILKLGGDDLEIDISIPRTDSKIGEGHRGFEVKVDPNMSIKDAARRRDFTFNALSKDPLTGEIFDPFGGVDDLQNRTLRVTDSDRFKDDPLRLLRAAQFAGRLSVRIEPASMALMREMVPELKEISPERVREEWEKLLLRSQRPSMGLYALHELGIIDEYYPELAALRGTEQEFDWHPEGDVWVHTLQVIDAAREIVRRENLDAETARVVMLAALCHDMGKALTTIYDTDGKIRSPGHDLKGEEPTRSFLKRIGARKKDVEIVVKLVREHMWPGAIYRAQKKYEADVKAGKKGSPVSDGAFRRFAKRIHPATLEQVTYVAEADKNGAGPFLDPKDPYQLLIPYGSPVGPWVRKRAQEVGIYKEKPKSLIMGRDLISLGFKPGRDFGAIINLADECRDRLELTREQVVLELEKCNGDAKSAISKLKSYLQE